MPRSTGRRRHRTFDRDGVPLTSSRKPCTHVAGNSPKLRFSRREIWRVRGKTTSEVFAPKRIARIQTRAATLIDPIKISTGAGAGRAARGIRNGADYPAGNRGLKTTPREHGANGRNKLACNLPRDKNYPAIRNSCACSPGNSRRGRPLPGQSNKRRNNHRQHRSPLPDGTGRKQENPPAGAEACRIYLQPR